MAKRAVVRVEIQEPAVRAAPDEMARRKRVAAIIRERMALPETKLGLELWQELKDEIDKGRRL